MVVSWAGFTLSMTILFLSMRAVLAIGGYCAEGGPYVIETHCPGNTEVLLPVSIYVGLAAVALSAFVARGLGASLILLAWPILFIGLSIGFLESALTPRAPEPMGIALGVMFFVMGAAPLVAWMRQPGNASAAIAGTCRSDGTIVGSVTFDWRLRPDVDPWPLRPRDYFVLIPLWLFAAGVGVYGGLMWFSA